MFSQPLKSRLPFLAVLMLLLPVVLAACGGGPTGNAEDFIKAMADNDKDKAKDVSCDAFHNEIDLLFEGDGGPSGELEDLKCEEDGDNVKCTGKDSEAEGEFVFAMEDDKVCGILSISTDGVDTGFAIPNTMADDLPSSE